MSHGSVGMDSAVSPLATYNSLTDGHLAGFYASPSKRRHLRKVGLISRSGHLISENTVRLNMAKKDRRRQIKNTLAQAIVEKTLELDRHRQNVIKQKLEEIAKMELVQRVREEEKLQPIRKKPSKFYSPRPQTAPLTTETELRRRNQEMLPYLSPRSPRRPTSGPAPNKTGSSAHGKYRPISAPLNNRPMSSSTKTSTNYDDYEDEEDVEYIDVNGESSSPRQNSYREEHTLDLNQLYTLNTVALRKYAMTLARLERGQNGTSPYTSLSTVPMPPRSPRNVHSARRRKYNSGGNSDRSPQRSSAAHKNHLHPSVTIHPGQLQSMVEVSMKYHGWNLSLARDEIDPRNSVIVEQQHCGGNTLTVFKQKLHPGSEFTFVSHRHRGYPFSLTIYVDGRMDSRVSTCCEYRHAKNVRLGGANGHFSIVDVKGNTPCFKCRVQKGGKKKKKKRSKPEPMVEEIVVKKSMEKSDKEEKNSDTESEEKETLVPVEIDTPRQITGDCDLDTGNYEDDFEQSDSEQKQDGGQNEDEDYTYINPSATERGDDWKTEVEENNQSSDNESNAEDRKTDEDDISTQKVKDASTSSKSEVKDKTKKKKDRKIKKKKTDSTKSEDESSHGGKSDTTKSSSKSADASKSSKPSSGSESSSSKSTSHEEDEDQYSTDEEEESSDTEVNTADEVSDIETEAESPRRPIAESKEPTSQRKVTFREEVSFASDVAERSEGVEENPNLLTPLSPIRRSGAQEDIYSSRENLYMPELDDVPESNAEVDYEPSEVAANVDTHEQPEKAASVASVVVEESSIPNPEPKNLQSSANEDFKEEKRVTSKPPKPRSKIMHQASIQVFVEDEESPIVSPHSDLRGEDQEQSRSEEAGLVTKESPSGLSQNFDGSTSPCETPPSPHAIVPSSVGDLPNSQTVTSSGQSYDADGSSNPQEMSPSPDGTAPSHIGTLPQTDDNSHTNTSNKNLVRNEDSIDREVDQEIDDFLLLCMDEAKDLVGNHNKLITEGPDKSKDYMINEADYSDEYCNRISQKDEEQRKNAKKEKTLTPEDPTASEVPKLSDKLDGLLKSSLKVENSPRKHVTKTVSFDTKVDIEPNPTDTEESVANTPEPVQTKSNDHSAGISTENSANLPIPTVVIEVDSKPISDYEESSSDSSDTESSDTSDSEATETISKNTEEKRSEIIDSTMTNYSFDK